MMPGAPGQPRAIVFDLDTAVIDRRRAWQYAVEEAILTAGGSRVAAGSLADEYHSRPWSHALSVLLDDPALLPDCEAMCEQYFRRSALKRLLVFEGIGMTLDRLRGDRVEMGGITRERHADAMRQIESTGIDRFLAVLAPTNEGNWDPAARFHECVAYLQCAAPEAVFVSAQRDDAECVAASGASVVVAGWGVACDAALALAHPSELRGGAIARVRG